MSDFLKSSLGSSSRSDVASRKEAMMNSIRSEIALANAQELMNKTNEKCFYKCVPKPSSTLSSSEESCLTRCLERYMDAFNVVSRTYTGRISKERLASGNGTNGDTLYGT